jgi:macrolide-specific efflux system membrane fusion protein
MIIKRLISLVILLVVIGAAGWGVYKTGALSPETDVVKPTPTDTATIRDVEESVLSVGEIAPVDETDIRSEVSGMVMSLKVEPGQRVAKGDELLQLDQRELRSEKNEDELELVAEHLKIKQAQDELDRDKELLGKGFMPKKDYEDADILLQLAKNAADVQQAKIDTLEQEIIKTDLKAPHDGVLLTVPVREGQNITGTNATNPDTLMTIADLSKLKVSTTFSEVDVVKVRVGDVVELRFDAVPDLVSAGKITYISPSAEAASTGSSSSSSGSKSSSNSPGANSGAKLFDAIITLDKIDERIRPGITAHVTIPLKKAAHVLTIPVTAVFSDNDQSIAFVKTGDKFDRRPVSLGLTDGAIIEVKSGLKEGDLVATERPPGEEPPPPKTNRHW